MKVYGQLEFCQLEQVKGLGALVGPAVNSRIVADCQPTLAQPYFYDGASWRKLLLGGMQRSVGTPVTSDSVFSSSSFADGTNQISLSFAATQTGKYKIWLNASIINSAGTGVIRINNSVGAATVDFSQEVGSTATQIGGVCFLLVQLTAGVTYTFKVQGKASSGNCTLKNSLLASGTALIAEQLD